MVSDEGTYSLTHLVTKYVLSTYYVLGPVPSARETGTKTSIAPALLLVPPCRLTVHREDMLSGK